MSAGEMARESAAVAAKIESLGICGKKVLVYNALPDEVDTREIVACLSADNDLYMPVVDGDDMLLAACDGSGKEGAFGISEPTGKRLAAREVMPDVCIVPLRAFDAQLNRLGRGKGYYDRFFAVCDCEKIAIAFDCQKFDEIEADERDVKMDAVVTASETYRK